MIRFLVLLTLVVAGCGKPDGHPTNVGPAGAFDPTAYGPREAPPNAPMPDPEVLDYGPRGDGIGIHAVGQVHVRFTQPMVPLGTDDDTTELRVLRDGSPVAGRAYWQTPTELVFATTDTLLPASRYDVVWDGSNDLASLSWSFETERPSAALAEPGDRAKQARTAAPLLLTTTISTTVEQLAPRLTLEANGAPVSHALQAPTEDQKKRYSLPEGMLFQLTHDPFPIGARVALSVSEGWRSSKGPLTASTALQAVFDVHPALSVTAVTCRESTGKCPMQPLEIQLSTQVAEGQERHITVRPKPPEFAVTTSHDVLRVDGRFVPGTTYSLEIGTGLTDVFGQRLKRKEVVKLDFAMPPPEVYLTQSTGNVLDDGRPHFGVSSRHVRKVRVRVAKVSIERFRQLHFDHHWNLKDAPPVNELGEVAEATLSVDLQRPTNWGSTPIDLTKIVGDYRGPIAVEVTGLQPVDGYEGIAEGLDDRGLFHLGSLGPHVFVSSSQSVVRVEDLASRKPVDGARVSLLAASTEQQLGVTDAAGLLTFEGRPTHARDDLVLVRAADGDIALLPMVRDPSPSSAPWLQPGEEIRAKLVTERGVYRPGDDVYVAGWAAVHTPHHPSGHRSLPGDVSVRLELRDSGDLVLDTANVDPRRGRFSAKLAVPSSARLGRLTVQAVFERKGVAAGDRSMVTAVIKEFRTPEFEVNTTTDVAQLVGKQAVTIDVESRYFSGSLAEIREARGTRSCWTASPPIVEGWQLGVDMSWGGTARMNLTPIPHGRGRLQFKDTPGPDESGKTRRCDYSVTVQNPSYQEEGAGEQLLVHPTPLYLGMPWWDDTPEEGDTLELRFALFDVDGKPSKAPAETVDVEILRTERRPVYTGRGKNGWVSHYEEEEVRTTKCTARTDGRASCGKEALRAGRYEIVATSRKDPLRRFERSVWVYERWDDEGEPAVVIDAPREQLPTDKLTAVIVRSKEKHGVLMVERFGIIAALPFETRRGRATIPLTPKQSWSPGVTLTAYAIKFGENTPELVSSRAELDFDASDRELEVSVHAPERAMVRDEIEVTVNSSANVGRAAIWVVDDAILNLTQYRLPDLVRAFYPDFVQDIRAYEQLYSTLPVFLPQQWDPYSAVLSGFGSGGGFGRGAGGLGRGGGPSPRADFRATPFFAGDVPIVNGTANISFKLPDNITRFRVLAVVSATQSPEGPPVRFGSGASTIDVSAPLIVRPALPRFLRPGDAPTLAAVVQNTTEKAGTLSVAFDVEGDVISWQPNVTPTTTKSVAAHGEVRVGFDARVVAPGEALVTVRAKFEPSDGSASFEDAVRLPLRSAPEPTLTQTVAMYGTLDDDGATGVPVRLPPDVQPDVGGISVTLTSTILGGLRDATRNLIEYPYGCAEQTSSRMLPLVALSDLKGFVDSTQIPDGRTIDEFVADGIARLISMQHSSGGFSYWPSGNAPNEYVSAYVTWVLWLAKQAGHAVPESALTRALDYLETVAKTPDIDLPDSVIYYGDMRRAIAAYTLAEAGRDTSLVVDRLLDQKELPVFARAFAIAALARSKPGDPRLDDQLRRLANKVTETPASAAVVETPRYDLGAFFHSDLRSSAITMMALTRAKPDHAVIVKLARGLMEKRYKGAWRNTQENAYALVALADYARHFERDEPNFEVKVWVDNAVLIDDRWSGRSSKARTGTIPMQQMSTLTARSADQTLPLNIRRRGEGRAYYRLAMTYAPASANLPPVARGIEVKRRFRRDGKPATTTAPDTLQAGEVFAVDVTVHTKALLRFVAIDVPVPAGLEPIDLSLGSRKTLPLGGTYGWWVSHIEHHDDRVVMFADTLQPGEHTRTVYLRATTPGTFSFPPTHAEAMYTPEVFGRSDGNLIEVEE